MIAGGLSGPTSTGAAGTIANAAAPALQYAVGQYFKGQQAEGSTAHIVAHTVLAAAVAAAGGNDALTAGLSAGGAEALAPVVSNWLFGKDAKELTADEKATVSNIVSLGAAGLTVGVGGTGADVVSSSQLASSAVENNTLTKEDWQNYVKLMDECYKTKQCDWATIDGYAKRSKQNDTRIRNLLEKSWNGELLNPEEYFFLLWMNKGAYNATSSTFAGRNDAEQAWLESKLGEFYYDPTVRDPKTGQTVQIKDAMLGVLQGDMLKKSPEWTQENKKVLKFIADWTPVIGDIKAFKEAETAGDYFFAVLGVAPGLGDAAEKIYKAKKAFKMASEAGNLPEMKKAVEAAGDAYKEAKAGTKGSWSSDLNPPTKAPDFKPSTTYNVDGHVFKTDAQGRVNKVEGQLSLDKADRNTYQQCAAGKCGNVGDQGGHLIASALGGAGDRINLLPMAQVLNQGAYKNMERELMDALKAGKSVSVKIDVGYPAGGGLRPSSFNVTAVVDGEVIPYRFTQ